MRQADLENMMRNSLSSVGQRRRGAVMASASSRPPQKNRRKFADGGMSPATPAAAPTAWEAMDPAKRQTFIGQRQKAFDDNVNTMKTQLAWRGKHGETDPYHRQIQDTLNNWNKMGAEGYARNQYNQFFNKPVAEAELQKNRAEAAAQQKQREAEYKAKSVESDPNWNRYNDETKKAIVMQKFMRKAGSLARDKGNGFIGGLFDVAGDMQDPFMKRGIGLAGNLLNKGTEAVTSMDPGKAISGVATAGIDAFKGLHDLIKNKESLYYKARGGHITSTQTKGTTMKNCKAEGGSIYERQMAGMRPGKDVGQKTYESSMNGERATAKAKYAIGGVGKQRHNQATASGAPKGLPRHRSARGG